jgi:RNA polymerase sigma-70 factor (ECF subfamily)
MSNAQDVALISKLLVFNDNKYFDKLVVKYQSFVRRFLLNLLNGDIDICDDLAQETFIKAYLNIQQFKGIANFSTWLTRIAYNVFYDYQRERASMKTERIEVADFLTTQEKPPMSDFDFRQMLSGLKTEERVAILLFYMEDFPVKKIAKTMNIAEGSVKSHLSRARNKIKQSLKFNK